MTKTKEQHLKMIPRLQLLKAAKQASITSEECYTSSSASFSSASRPGLSAVS